jgi:hypothetical protein
MRRGDKENRVALTRSRLTPHGLFRRGFISAWKPGVLMAEAGRLTVPC